MIQKHQPVEAETIRRNYRINLQADAGRRLLVREFVAKQARRVDQRRSVWQRLGDVVLRVLARAGPLPRTFAGRALDARIRALTRKAIGQLAARAPAPPRDTPRGVSYSQEEAIPTALPSQLSTPEPATPQEAEHAGSRRAQESTLLSEDVKQRIFTQYRTIASNQGAEAAARQMVADLGVDEAIRLALNPPAGLPGQLRFALGGIAIPAELARLERAASQFNAISGLPQFIRAPELTLF